MQNLFGFDELIEKFVKKEISGDGFEEAYLEKFLEEKNPISEELFLSLDWLFAEIDGFSDDPELFPDSHVSEDQLRESAAKVLKEIRALK